MHEKIQQSHARLRFEKLGAVVIDGGLFRKKSGRCSSRGTPERLSSSTTRSTGMPALRHLWIACGEMPNALASAPTPPDRSMTCSTTDMPRSQPQVDSTVNRPLLAVVNRGFQAADMQVSALGQVIKARLKAINQTQDWLAEKVNVSPQAVSKWIRTGDITLDNARDAARWLGISVGQLLDSNPDTEVDDRWHSLPISMRAHLLALLDGLAKAPSEVSQPVKVERKRSRTHG